nr:protein translocase subunit SecD [uncultured bacterium]
MGIVLGIICLVLTIINSAIGAYQGYHGEAWFQKGSNIIEENVGDDHTSGKQETNVFTLRDSDGNILMTGGIKSAEATMVDNGDGIKKAVVQIEFDDESTKTFADITTNNIGNTIGIYLNDEMIANPRVMCAITEGSCQIEVDTYEQAQVLSEALEKCK